MPQIGEFLLAGGPSFTPPVGAACPNDVQYGPVTPWCPCLPDHKASKLAISASLMPAELSGLAGVSAGILSMEPSSWRPMKRPSHRSHLDRTDINALSGKMFS